MLTSFSACLTSAIIQVLGAALIGKSESAKVRNESFGVTPEQANNILIAGLAVQTFSFLCFLCILFVAIWRAHKQACSRHTVDHREYREWPVLQSFLWVILATALLILLRTVFRLGESAEGEFDMARLARSYDYHLGSC